MGLPVGLIHHDQPDGARWRGTDRQNRQRQEYGKAFHKQLDGGGAALLRIDWDIWTVAVFKRSPMLAETLRNGD
jgi:hypothetical protein